MADCNECEKIGKVCFQNDGGLSHRISQGEATESEVKLHSDLNKEKSDLLGH